MFSGCLQDFSRMFSGCSDGSCGPGGISWSFQMKVWTLMIQRNSMVRNYLMIPAIQWSPAILSKSYVMAACSLARKCVHCHIALTGNSLIFNSESVYIVSSKLLVMCRTAMEVKLCPILCKVRGDFVQCPKNDSSWRPSAILLWFIFSADNVWRVCKNVICANVYPVMIQIFSKFSR